MTNEKNDEKKQEKGQFIGKNNKITWLGKNIKFTDEDRKKLDKLFKKPFEFTVVGKIGNDDFLKKLMNHPRQTGKSAAILKVIDIKDITICDCECGGHCYDCKEE